MQEKKKRKKERKAELSFSHEVDTEKVIPSVSGATAAFGRSACQTLAL